MGRLCIVFTVAAMAFASLQSRAEDPVAVDVALALAVDISYSMDREEQRVQREGYVAAIRHPAFISAVERGPLGRVALAYFEWGGPNDQRLLIDWTIIDGAEAAEAFSARLASRRYAWSGGTSISGAIDFARGLMDRAPPAARHVLDISGDGPNNMGDPVLEARARAVEDGIEINGLPIMIKDFDAVFSIPDLDIYYETCVITGPASFLIAVTDKTQFTAAIRQKLILEVAQAGPPGVTMTDRSTVDCLVGERLYQRWLRSRSPG